MGKAVDAVRNGIRIGEARLEKSVENKKVWRARTSVKYLMVYLEAGGPVNEDGETPDREAVIIALWELERVLYGKKQTHVDLELKWYTRAKRVVNKLRLT